jgi:hypothetical protein
MLHFGYHDGNGRNPGAGTGYPGTPNFSDFFQVDKLKKKTTDHLELLQHY